MPEALGVSESVDCRVEKIFKILSVDMVCVVSRLADGRVPNREVKGVNVVKARVFCEVKS